jgi:hypothetical protein
MYPGVPTVRRSIEVIVTDLDEVVFRTLTAGVNVGGLDVAVSQTLRVRFGERAANLLQHEHDAARR